MEWKQQNTCIIGEYNNPEQNKRKCACFDLDDTIIKPKSGKKFAQDKDDWIFLFENVPLKIRELSKTHNIIIFTNQAGLKDKSKENEWKNKVENVCDAICSFHDKDGKMKMENIPITIYAALKNDYYRKPVPTMWEEFISENAKNKESFFVGDACGRKGDFSDTDLKFALNCGLKFYTPEEFFLEKKQKIPEISYINFPINKYEYKFNPKIKEMIIMVGIPGSGKTTFVKKYILPHNYVHINRDTIKTSIKCLNETKKCLEKNLSVVIDNTNPSQSCRQKYIEIAKEFNYNIRCIIINCDKELAQHNAMYRNYMSNGEIDNIPNLVYNMYNKNFEKPDSKEGLNEVCEIDTVIEEPNEKYKLYMV